MLNLDQKIKEIQQKPDRVRIRYIYAIVSLIIIIVLAIWLLSIRVEFKKAGDVGDRQDLKEIFNNISSEELKNNAVRSLDDIDEQGEEESVENDNE